MPMLTTNDIVLYAENTGQLYATHRSMARNRAPVQIWEKHVRETVLPRYRQEIEHATASIATIKAAATEMHDNYARRLKEEIESTTKELKIRFSLENAAFDGDASLQASYILGVIAREVLSAGFTRRTEVQARKVYDQNGNVIGTWEVSD